MEQVGKWILEHQIIIGVAVTMIGGVSALINLKKIVRGAGKAYSTIIRKYFGKKAEEGQEALAQEFVAGMKDDNK